MCLRTDRICHRTNQIFYVFNINIQNIRSSTIARSPLTENQRAKSGIDTKKFTICIPQVVTCWRFLQHILWNCKNFCWDGKSLSIPLVVPPSNYSSFSYMPSCFGFGQEKIHSGFKQAIRNSIHGPHLLEAM
jgi:hypothetical protein